MRLLHALLLCVVFLPAISSRCNKEEDKNDTFCSVSRTIAGTIDRRTGTVSYYNRYKRYAIVIDSTVNNNIDNTYIGLVCSMPDTLQSPGTKVTLSGTLKNFQANENIKPLTGGEHLYYLEIRTIDKKRLP